MKLLFPICLLCTTLQISAQINLTDTVRLVKGHKTKILNQYKDVTIISSVRDNGTYDEAWAYFDTVDFRLRNDTLAMPAIYTYFAHFKDGREDSSAAHNYPDSAVTIMKIAVKDIDKIEVVIPKIRRPTGIVAGLSLVSALVVAPLVSIGKPFKSDRFYRVAGYSLGVFAVSMSISLGFGEKTFHLKSKHERKNWSISK